MSLCLENLSSAFFSYAVFIFVLAAAYVAVYFLIAKDMRLNEERVRREKKVLLLFDITILSSIVLSSLYEENIYVFTKIDFVVYAFDSLCSLFILIVSKQIIHIKKVETDVQMLQMLREKEKQQYLISKQNIDLINIKCHDIKHYLAQMRNSGNFSAETHLARMEELVSVYDKHADTGNEVIDVVINEKSLFCVRQDIDLSVMVDGAQFLFMEETDAYSLFANILDNAVFAAGEIEEKEKRVVSLTSSRAPGMLFLHCENYYGGQVLIENGMPKTRQADDNVHGFGTKSIAYVAKKYGGEAIFKAEDDIFTVDCAFPVSR